MHNIDLIRSLKGKSPSTPEIRRTGFLLKLVAKGLFGSFDDMEAETGFHDL